MRRILVRFALSFITVFSARSEELTDLEEGVGGGDSVLPAGEAQPVVSQAETLDETPSSAIPSGEFRPFASISGGSNIDHSQPNLSDQSIQTGQDSSQAEAQIRAYFLMIQRHHWPDGYKINHG
jgi:hypothetical protein